MGILQIVDLLQEHGVDINEISRLTGQHRETVRYRYNSVLRDRGMIVEAVIDEGAFGLKPLGTKVRLADAYLSRAQQVWRLLHELAYLRTEDASLTDDYFHLRWAVPSECASEFRDFLLELQDVGVFEDMKTYDFAWTRRLPMAAQHYDFGKQQWSFDWKTASLPSLTPPTAMLKEPTSVKKVRFDAVDLVLASELQQDAGRSMVDIQRKMGSEHDLVLNYKTLQYHYYSHLVRSKLLKNYVIGWQGVQPGMPAEEAQHRMSRYLMVALLARGVDSFERDQLMSRMVRTPFLWAEAGGKDYQAKCAFPIEMAAEGLEFMRDTLRLIRGKTEYYVMDRKNSALFTINEKLWDSARRKWRFDKDRALGEFKRKVTAGWQS